LASAIFAVLTSGTGGAVGRGGGVLPQAARPRATAAPRTMEELRMENSLVAN
jgi:hypothetical protein